MAKYIAIATCWLKPDDHAAPCVVQAGDVVTYSGEPGTSLAPLDAAARVAKDAARARRDWFTRRIDDLKERRAIAKLSRSHRRLLDEAQRKHEPEIAA